MKMSYLKLFRQVIVSVVIAVLSVSAFAGESAPKAHYKHGLNWDLYVYETFLVKSMTELEKILPAHLEFQVEIERKGIMLFAGPLREEGVDKPGAGMIVIRAKSFEEAKRIADSDPIHSSGVRNYRLRKWTVNEGNFNLNVDLSDQSGKFN